MEAAETREAKEHILAVILARRPGMATWPEFHKEFAK